MSNFFVCFVLLFFFFVLSFVFCFAFLFLPRTVDWPNTTGDIDLCIYSYGSKTKTTKTHVDDNVYSKFVDFFPMLLLFCFVLVWFFCLFVCLFVCLFPIAKEREKGGGGGRERERERERWRET